MHYLETSKLNKCSSAIKKDKDTFGISCVKTLLDFQKVNNVKHTTDIARLKKEATKAASTHKPWLEVEENNSDVVAIYNATLLTMESGNDAVDLINAGVLVVRGGVIEYAGPLHQYDIPTGATVIDADGGKPFRRPYGDIEYRIFIRLRCTWFLRCPCALEWIFG